MQRKQDNFKHNHNNEREGTPASTTEHVWITAKSQKEKLNHLWNRPSAPNSYVLPSKYNFAHLFSSHLFSSLPFTSVSGGEAPNSSPAIIVLTNVGSNHHCIPFWAFPESTSHSLFQSILPFLQTFSRSLQFVPLWYQMIWIEENRKITAKFLGFQELGHSSYGGTLLPNRQTK